MTADARSRSRSIGRFTLYEAIASGGMASVHLGRMSGPLGFGRIVAIKQLHSHLASDPEFVAMFLDEVSLSARIQHPNVVAMLDVFAEDGAPRLVMEYIHGEPLSWLLLQSFRAGAAVPLAVTSAILGGVLRGLHAAHEARSERGEPLRLVHRDVSPQNILIGADGVPRVFDFGIAKAAARIRTTVDGAVRGKLAYMAPEQINRQDVDRRADVYSAGVVLWEAIAGRRLFRADDASGVLAAVLTPNIPSLCSLRPEVSADLDACVRSALSFDRNGRPESALALAQSLQRAIPAGTPDEVSAWAAPHMQDRLAERSKRLEEITTGEIGTGEVGPEWNATVGAVVLSAVRADADVDTKEEALPPLLAYQPAPPRRAVRRIGLFVGIAALLVGAGALRLRGRGAADRSPPHAFANVPSTATDAPATSTEDAPRSPPAPTASASNVGAADPAPARSPVDRPARPTGPRPAPRKCDPPTFVDGAGIKRVKPGCS